MDEVEDLVALLTADPSPARVAHLDVDADGLYTPLYYATEILRELRRQRTSYRTAERRRPGRKWLDPMVTDARPHVRTLFGRTQEGKVAARHADRAAPLRSWLRQKGDDDYPPIVLARVVARAIEDEYASSFWEQIRLYYGVTELSGETITSELRSGDPVPVCDTIYAGRLASEEQDGGPQELRRRGDYGTNPRNLPRWRDPDRLSRILLAPVGIEQFRVVLDFSLDSDLELLRPSRRIATVHPTADLSTDYAWDDDGHHFFDVHPRCETDTPPGMDSAVYLQLMKDGIQQGVEAGASLVVLPELALTAEQSGSLGEYWNELTESYDGSSNAPAPVVLVAGSHHVTDQVNDKRCNRATIVGKGVVRTVDKSVPYVHSNPASPHGDLVEGISQHPHPLVTIFCSERMTMTALVCVDYLLDSLRDVIRDLDVTLTVLPSMTGKSKVFSGLMAGHVASTQGAVVMANALRASDDGARGVIGHPRFADHVLRLDDLWQEGAGDGPGVALVDVEDPTASAWIPLTVS